MDCEIEKLERRVKFILEHLRDSEPPLMNDEEYEYFLEDYGLGLRSGDQNLIKSLSQTINRLFILIRSVQLKNHTDN